MADLDAVDDSKEYYIDLPQKSEVFSLKSKLRRVQVELDSLRNESIEDDIILTDEVDDSSL